MKLVGAGLGGHGHVGAGRHAKFRTGDVGLNFELLDGVNGRLNAVGFEESFIVGYAIKRVVILLKAVAADAVIAAAGCLIDGAVLTLPGISASKSV